MKRVALVLAAVFSACEPSLPMESFCAELARAGCVARQRCGLLSASADCSTPSVSDCLANHRDTLARNLEHYDPVAALACVEATRNNTECSPSFSNPIDSCLAVVVGNGNEGDACGTCAEGLRCNGEEGQCGTCVKATKIPLRGLGGACGGVGPDSSANCENGLWCGGGVCKPFTQVGEACDEKMRCVAGSWCINGVCVADGELGESCVDRDCKGGLLCVDGVCERIRDVGEACASGLDCKFRTCVDGTCRPLRQTGESCGFDAYCQLPLRCIDDVCTAYPAVGEACTGLCERGRCVEGVCVDNRLLTCG